MNKSGIYKITSLKSNKFYIGSSQNLKKRALDHKSLLRNNKHPNRYLQFTWNKYKDLFFEIIEECSIENLIEREQFYIDKLKPEFNLRPLAENNRGWKMPNSAKEKLSNFNKGKKLSEEHKKQISKNNSKNLKGRKLSDKHIEAIRRARTGWKLSSETKEKIKQKALGRDKGKKLSEETKRKIGLASSKEVFQYSKEGTFIYSYISSSEAERKTGISKSSISSCCRNNRKTAGNFKWYYEKQDN